MKTTSNNIHSRFFGLLKSLPYLDKQDLVWQYSNMLTTSLSDFYTKDPIGYRKMITDMQKMVDSLDKKTEIQVNNTADPSIKKLRSGILHRLQRYGIDTTDWKKVNAFLEQPRIAGKRLYDMSAEEMGDFIKKMESILKKEEKQRAEIERLAHLN